MTFLWMTLEQSAWLYFVVSVVVTLIAIHFAEGKK